MKFFILLFFTLFSSAVHCQNKSFDYAYINKKGICVYSIAEKKEYFVSKEGLDPCISPDGSKVAYSAFNNNQRFINIVDLNTKKSTRLNVNGNNSFGPVWSPNGKFIAYNSFNNQNMKWSVAVVDIANGSPIPINQAVKESYSPTWTYDSQNVVIQNLENVFVLDLKGDIVASYDVSKMTSDFGPSSSDAFLFTKDNKKIIFSSGVDEPGGDNGPPTSVFIYDIKSKTTLRLSPKGYFAQHLIMKDDKVLVTAVQVKSNIGGIYTVDLDGKNFKMLFPNWANVSAKK